LFQAVKAILILQTHLKISKTNNFSTLSVRALAGDLRDCSTVKEILADIKKLDSESLELLFSQLLKELGHSDVFQELQKELTSFLKTEKATGSLRSKHGNNSHYIMKTSIVGRQAKLGQANTGLSDKDLRYSDLLDRLHAALETFFTTTLINPQNLFLNEVFLFDLKNPLKETFTPRVRFAIERALSTPFDYLMPMSDEVEHLSAGQPATAILYQLYLESGSLVSIYDLWKAFSAIVDGEETETADERLTFTLFYQSLSELKALGMVKSSRKKIDHIAKSAWNGL
jgi:origin recognition complex subunit 3